MTDSTAISPFVLWLLPGLFVLHDLEETLFFKPWLRHNVEQLVRQTPAFVGRVIRRLEKTSVGEFAAMAAEELLILIAATLYASFSGIYWPWLALLLGFGVHLIVHLAQWAVVGGYVPSAVTSLLCLPVCIYITWLAAGSGLFSAGEFLLCGLGGTAAAAANLLAIHRAAAFVRERRKRRNQTTNDIIL